MSQKTSMNSMQQVEFTQNHPIQPQAATKTWNNEQNWQIPPASLPPSYSESIENQNNWYNYVGPPQNQNPWPESGHRNVMTPSSNTSVGYSQTHMQNSNMYMNQTINRLPPQQDALASTSSMTMLSNSHSNNNISNKHCTNQMPSLCKTEQSLEYSPLMNDPTSPGYSLPVSSYTNPPPTLTNMGNQSYNGYKVEPGTNYERNREDIVSDHWQFIMNNTSQYELATNLDEGLEAAMKVLKRHAEPEKNMTNESISMGNFSQNENQNSSIPINSQLDMLTSYSNKQVLSPEVAEIKVEKSGLDEQTLSNPLCGAVSKITGRGKRSRSSSVDPESLPQKWLALSSATLSGDVMVKEEEDCIDDDPETKASKEKERRRANNARERVRVRSLNEAYKELERICTVHCKTDKAFTKLNVLQMAVDTIKKLESQVKSRNLNPRSVALNQVFENNPESPKVPSSLNVHSPYPSSDVHGNYVVPRENGRQT